jgi:glyoxylase-like metal-dependent hydrolase (beta-lactamase superfamily II)
MFDKKSRLPLLIRTVEDDPMRGTVAFDVKFEDWKPVEGAMLAHRITYQIGDVVLARMFYREVIANPEIDPAKFAPPASIRASLKPPATGDVPYQWVLRQLYLGLFLDSDRMYVEPGGSLKLVELAPNVQQVVGGSHNSLIVSLKDGIAVFDAPIGEAQSRWTIDAAKAKYGKPVKYLVLTHHHRDHVAGTRAYMAEGAKIIVPSPAGKYISKHALGQRLLPDLFQRRRMSALVEEVKDELKIGEGEIVVYRIANPHVDGMLIGHVVSDNIVWVTDLYSPGQDRAKTAGNLAFHEALKRLNIRNATIAGGHGGAGPQADLEKFFVSQ